MRNEIINTFGPEWWPIIEQYERLSPERRRLAQKLIAAIIKALIEDEEDRRNEAD